MEQDPDLKGAKPGTEFETFEEEVEALPQNVRLSMKNIMNKEGVLNGSTYEGKEGDSHKFHGSNGDKHYVNTNPQNPSVAKTTVGPDANHGIKTPSLIRGASIEATHDGFEGERGKREVGYGGEATAVKIEGTKYHINDDGSAVKTVGEINAAKAEGAIKIGAEKGFSAGVGVSAFEVSGAMSYITAPQPKFDANTQQVILEQHEFGGSINADVGIGIKIKAGEKPSLSGGFGAGVNIGSFHTPAEMIASKQGDELGQLKKQAISDKQKELDVRLNPADHNDYENQRPNASSNAASSHSDIERAKQEQQQLNEYRNEHKDLYPNEVPLTVDNIDEQLAANSSKYASYNLEEETGANILIRDSYQNETPSDRSDAYSSTSNYGYSLTNESVASDSDFFSGEYNKANFGSDWNNESSANNTGYSYTHENSDWSENYIETENNTDSAESDWSYYSPSEDYGYTNSYSGSVQSNTYFEEGYQSEIFGGDESESSYGNGYVERYELEGKSASDGFFEEEYQAEDFGGNWNTTYSANDGLGEYSYESTTDAYEYSGADYSSEGTEDNWSEYSSDNYFSGSYSDVSAYGSYSGTDSSVEATDYSGSTSSYGYGSSTTDFSLGNYGSSNDYSFTSESSSESESSGSDSSTGESSDYGYDL